MTKKKRILQDSDESCSQSSDVEIISVSQKPVRKLAVAPKFKFVKSSVPNQLWIDKYEPTLTNLALHKQKYNAIKTWLMKYTVSHQY